MLAADSSTDSVTELIDLERDAEDDHVVGGWDDSPPTISPPPQHQDPLQESPKKPSQTKRPSPLDEIVFIDDDDEPIEPAAETFTAASPQGGSSIDIFYLRQFFGLTQQGYSYDQLTVGLT